MKLRQKERCMKIVPVGSPAVLWAQHAQCPAHKNSTFHKGNFWAAVDKLVGFSSKYYVYCFASIVLLSGANFLRLASVRIRGALLD